MECSGSGMVMNKGIAERRGGLGEADAVPLLVDDSLVWVPVEAKHVLPLLFVHVTAPFSAL